MSSPTLGTPVLLISFEDEVTRSSVSFEGRVHERIAATLRSAGLDAPNELYNEALAFARDGHLEQAQARLQMLLCFDPDDADAHLLLAKVLAAQGRPSDALIRLNKCIAVGGLGPAGFREQLEGAMRAELARAEEHRERIAAREKGEVRSLRNETRTLRSEYVRLETDVTDLLRSRRNWKYTSLFAGLLAVTTILAGGFISKAREDALQKEVGVWKTSMSEWHDLADEESKKAKEAEAEIAVLKEAARTDEASIISLKSRLRVATDEVWTLSTVIPTCKATENIEESKPESTLGAKDDEGTLDYTGCTAGNEINLTLRCAYTGEKPYACQVTNPFAF